MDESDNTNALCGASKDQNQSCFSLTRGGAPVVQQTSWQGEHRRKLTGARLGWVPTLARVATRGPYMYAVRVRRTGSLYGWHVRAGAMYG